MSEKRICVFCGSSDRVSSGFLKLAATVGQLLAEQNVTLIYGGADVGMMGALAKAALENDGTVIGVIPRSIHERVGHHTLSETVIVETMHERKAKMHELADGFLALPGGLGTLEELFEALTWQQLGYHTKPCGILNTDGFYRDLLRFMDHLVDEHFLRWEHRDLLLVEKEPRALLKQLVNTQLRLVDKWQNED